MNYVKNIYKNRFIWLVIGVLFSFCVIMGVSCGRSKDSFKFLTIKQDYQVVGKNNVGLLQLDIYENHKNSYYLNTEAIESVYLKEKNSDSVVSVELKNIVEVSDFSYEEIAYTKYRLDIEIPLESIGLFTISKCMVELNFVNEEKVVLPMGSFNYISQEGLDNPLNMPNLKGIVNPFEEVNYLSGVLITLQNETNHEVTITSIETISENVLIQNNNIEELLSNDIKEETPMDELIHRDFNLKDIERGIFQERNITNSRTTLLLPLGYKELFPITKLGLIIYGTVDNVEFKQIIHPFKFYNSSTIQPIYYVTNYEVD
jgi:hypothetical protein